MMLTYHLALVSQTPAVRAESVMEVAAALQRQIVRDFGPVWGVIATVEPFARLDQVPTGYWPIILRDDLPDRDVEGVHRDDHGQPLALIKADAIWSLTASHEALELLADPLGNRLLPGSSIQPGGRVVEYVVEVADPVAENAYSVNGILVSDFVTPEYFADPAPVSGASYSFTGAITRPHEVIEGGYVTWREPNSGALWQAERVAGRLRFSKLSGIGNDRLALRRLVRSAHGHRGGLVGLPGNDPRLRSARKRHAAEAGAASVRARAWERLIGGLVAGGRPAPSGALPPATLARRDQRTSRAAARPRPGSLQRSRGTARRKRAD